MADRRFPTSALLPTAAILSGALLLSACDTTSTDGTASTAGGTSSTAATGEDRPELDLLDIPTVSGAWSGEMAVADGINPPTNSWVSPAVFAPEDRPIFTGVLSARLAADTVTVGLPRPVTEPNVIMAPHPDEVPLELAADGYELGRLDAVSARFDYREGETPVGELTLAEGWPYAQYRAVAEQLVGLPDGVTADGDDLSLTVGETTYRLVTDGAVDGTELTLAEGQLLHVYAEPADASADTLTALRAGALPLEGTEVEPGADGDRSTTTLRYLTEGGEDTVIGVAPRKELVEAEARGTPYQTVLGDVSLVTGTEVTTSVPVQEPVTELDLSGLDAQERAEVEGLLEDDVEALTFEAPDSYHGGKELQRAANLLVLADQLGRDDLADAVREPLTEQLDLWFDPAGCTGRGDRCFVYDETLGGLVGQTAAYGSDEFNDHHFHYGHILYAAGVVAADDAELAERWAPVADLVARDYGAPQASQQFPQNRTFDHWRGHSWASGTGPFADGNNQESSSEAVNGYAGLALWAQASGDDELTEHASWLLSQETASALNYWIDPEVDEAFGQPVVSLNWQGKRDFTTFFSAEPSAVVGIQLIPMNPTQVDYLSSRPEAVEALAEAVPSLTPEAPLADYVMMAAALVDPERAAEALDGYGVGQVDGGTSLSYATALVLSR